MGRLFRYKKFQNAEFKRTFKKDSSRNENMKEAKNNVITAIEEEGISTATLKRNNEKGCNSHKQQQHQQQYRTSQTFYLLNSRSCNKNANREKACLTAAEKSNHQNLKSFTVTSNKNCQSTTTRNTKTNRLPNSFKDESSSFSSEDRIKDTPSRDSSRIFWKKTKSKVYGFMKDLLKNKLQSSSRCIHEHTYIEFPPNNSNIKVINNNLGNNNNIVTNSHQKEGPAGIRKERDFSDNQLIKFNIMQDVRMRVLDPSVTGSSVAGHRQTSPDSRRRPIHLFSSKTNLDDVCYCSTTGCNDNDNTTTRSPISSEEDNSPTEMNNCRRLIDKPPLVKRLTMGLIRSTEESRPLVHNTSSLNSGSSQTISDGYVNEGICEPDKLISAKFGDSCRQSLTALPMESLHHHLNNVCGSSGGGENSEFNFKKKYLRETSSANSSPKIFAPSTPLRIDSLSPSEQNELKGAAWYQAGLPREISLEVLSRQNPGAFLVRQSSTKPGCFALSLRVPPPAPKVAHYLILRTSRGYKIKGFTKEFSSLRALITHHSVMPELLPVPLALPRPTQSLPPRRDLDDFDTYSSLSDFRKMMSDMNV